MVTCKRGNHRLLCANGEDIVPKTGIYAKDKNTLKPQIFSQIDKFA